MQFCPSCGKEIPDEIEFCPYCGTKVLREKRSKSISSPGAKPLKRQEIKKESATVSTPKSVGGPTKKRDNPPAPTSIPKPLKQQEINRENSTVSVPKPVMKPIKKREDPPQTLSSPKPLKRQAVKQESPTVSTSKPDTVPIKKRENPEKQVSPSESINMPKEKVVSVSLPNTEEERKNEKKGTSIRKKGLFYTIGIICLIGIAIYLFLNYGQKFTEIFKSVWSTRATSPIVTVSGTDQLSMDIDKDGKLEKVIWKKFSSTDLGDYYQLLVLDDDGSVLWKGPKKADDTDPLVFYALDTGVSLPQLLTDFDLDGNIELLAPMAQSDVSPTYYRKLRWRGNRFEPLLQSALMYEIGSNNHYIWKQAIGVGGTWVSKLSRAKNGEIVAEITQMRDYGGVDMGEVSIVFDTKGATVKRVLRPPAKVGGNTVTSPFSGSLPKNNVVQTPASKSNVYQAEISDRDHYNSRGVRLSNLASVLRQDRANYYKYGGDSRDQSDRYFKSINNRKAMERITINPVGISYRALKDLVVHGTPLLKVEVEQSRLNIRVIER